MTVSDDDIITLTSSDQKKVEITVKAAKVSELIATTLFSADENDDDDDVMMEQNDSAALEMDVPRVNGATLEKVVEFLIYFEKHPFPKMPEKLSGQTFNLVRL
jgi:Skp1 family, tetramerisation domain